MRILALTTQYPTPYRPHSCAHNRQQLAALSQQGDVEVIAPIAWLEEWTGREKRCAMPGDRQLRRDAIRVSHPRFYYPPALLRRWHGACYRFSVRQAFEEALETFDPDVIYSPWAYPDGWSAVRLGHAVGRPVVVKVMGSDVHTLDRYPGRRRGTLETLREADGIIAVSRQLAEEVTRLGANPEQVHVVYNGVDQDVFCPGSRSESRQRLGLDPATPRFLFVGNLVPVKQIPVLLEACRILQDRRQDFHCHLLGEGPLRKRLLARIEQLLLQKRMTLVGQRPHGELPDWFRAADAVVLPSRSEGVPNVLLEAKACGAPFVASRVGGIPEIAGPFDQLVPPNDPLALADALQVILAQERPDLPIALPHPSWAESARELLSVFEQVQMPKPDPAGQPVETISSGIMPTSLGM